MAPRIEMGEERRGRSSKFNLDCANLNSIVLIASKYDLEPKQLIDAFFDAWKNERSHCGSLEISCRKVNQDSATFLLTKEEKVVWQFPVNLEIIRNPHIRDSITRIPMPEKVKIGESGRNLKIGDLRFGMKGINLHAKVVEIPPTRHVFTRWEAEADVSNVKLADETGSIRLGLWNGQIETVHVGDNVEIKNCSVTKFANDPQLRLGRNSTISIINQLQQEEMLQHPIL